MFRRWALPWPAAQDALLPVAGLVAVWFTVVDHLRRSDFLVFVQAAQDVTAGVNPFTDHADPFLWGGSAYVYPYLTSLLFVPFTWLPLPLADVLWFALTGLAMVAGCRLLGLRDPVAVTALLLCAATMRTFQVGALNPLLFLAAAAMWRYRDRAGVVVGCFTLLVGAKLFLAPLALWLVLSRPRRTWALALGGASAYLALGFLVGPIGPQEYLAETRALAEHEQLQGMSLVKLVHDVVPGRAEQLLPVVLAMTLSALALLLVRSWKADRAAARRGALSVEAERFLLCTSLVIALLLTPIFWSHYIVVAYLVPLLLRPRRSTVLVMLPVSWLISRPHATTSWLSMPSVWRCSLLFGLLLAGVAAAALTARRTRPNPSAQVSFRDLHIGTAVVRLDRTEEPELSAR